MDTDSINFEAALGEYSLPVVANSNVILTRFDAEVDNLLMLVQAHQVNGPDSQGQAVILAGNAKKINAAIEKIRVDLVAPALEHQRKVNALAKGYQDKLKAAENDLKHKIASYQQKVEMERRKDESAALEAARKLQEEVNRDAKKAGVAPVQVLAQVIAPQPVKIRTEVGTAYQHTEWRHEIIDTSLVPKEYLMVDERKIREAIKAGVRDIPGCRIYEEKSIRMRV